MTQSLVTFTFVCSPKAGPRGEGHSEGSRACPGVPEQVLPGSQALLSPEPTGEGAVTQDLCHKEARSGLSKCLGAGPVQEESTQLPAHISLPCGCWSSWKNRRAQEAGREAAISPESISRAVGHTGQPQTQLPGLPSCGRVSYKRLSFSRQRGNVSWSFHGNGLHLG